MSLLDRVGHLDPESRRLLAFRVGELIDYQDARYAAAYVDFVLVVAAREEAMAAGRRDVTHAVIRNLYKLMAYKDEYEVARLHLKPAFQAGTRGLFTAPRRVDWHFHPPLLRALGLRRKLRLGPWFAPAAPRAPGAPARPRGTPLRPLRVRRRPAGGAAARPVVPGARVRAPWTAPAPTATRARSSWRGSPSRSAATRTSSSAQSPKYGVRP